MLKKCSWIVILLLGLSSAGHAEGPSCLMLFRTVSDQISIRSDEMAKVFAELAEHPGVTVETILVVDGTPIQKIHIRSSRPGAKKVFLSAGVHGNEPLGVVTLLHFLKEMMVDPRWSAKYDFTVIPMVNPHGIDTYDREFVGADGVPIDLNRSFIDGQWHFVSEAIAKSLENDTFDYAIDLHGAVNEGFFFIRAHENDQNMVALSVANLLLPRLGSTRVYINPVKEDPFYVFEEPGLARSHNVGTFKTWLYEHTGARMSYTLEYPRGMDPQHSIALNLHILEKMLESFRILDFTP